MSYGAKAPCGRLCLSRQGGEEDPKGCKDPVQTPDWGSTHEQSRVQKEISEIKLCLDRR